MTTRRGFTLLEVLVALVVTSVVLLVGYTALASGLDTRDRLAAQRTTLEREARTMALVRDALRHIVDAEYVDVAPLSLTRAAGGGVYTDALVIITRGLDTPQGSGRLWRLSVSADSLGVRIAATPLLRADEAPTRLPPPLETRLTHLEGVRVQVLATPGAAAWRDDWPEPAALPAAVAIRFVARDTARTIAPLVVRLGAPAAA